MDETPLGISTTRLYGGAIGVVSGGYALLAAAGDGAATLLMLLVGVVALVHGVVLFTPVADRLGAASGPLMVVYAVVMLALQGWAETMDPMADGMGGMGQQGTMAAGADLGMVSLAVLMLFSGLVMTAGRQTDGGM